MKKFLRVLAGILGVFGIGFFSLIFTPLELEFLIFQVLIISTLFLAYGVGAEKAIGAVLPGLLRSKW